MDTSNYNEFVQDNIVAKKMVGSAWVVPPTHQRCDFCVMSEMQCESLERETACSCCGGKSCGSTGAVSVYLIKHIQSAA